MNCYTIEFYKKIYRALKNSYTVYSTCVRTLYFELELGRVDFAEKPKKEPCSATTQTDNNSSHI